MPRTISDMVGKFTEEFAEQMAYELRGAWRAGYDYLHVYDAPGPAGPWDDTELKERLTVRQYVYPSHKGAPRPSPDALVYRYTYDLTSVPDDVIRSVIRGETDPTELEVWGE